MINALGVQHRDMHEMPNSCRLSSGRSADNLRSHSLGIIDSKNEYIHTQVLWQSRSKDGLRLDEKLKTRKHQYYAVSPLQNKPLGTLPQGLFHCHSKQQHQHRQSLSFSLLLFHHRSVIRGGGEKKAERLLVPGRRRGTGRH